MIGIDLGTTHSLVARWDDERGEVQVIPNQLGEQITPSVVSVLANEEFLVGRAARNRLLTHPLSSVGAFKRKMATPSKYRLGSHRLTAVELSALVLKQLKADAEAYLQAPVSDAVISVPAYFNDSQRQATRIAAEMAGLSVERLVNEPTAAAIAYGMRNNLEEARYLVVDLGGGTLDVSLLEIFEGVIEVRACAGDNFLGGEDFTQLLVDDFCRSQGITLEMLSPNARGGVCSALNELKEKLTSEREVEAKIRIDGESESVVYSLSRARFEELAEPLLKRIRAPIERVLRDCKLSPSDISKVVLAGGATRSPCVRRLIGTLLRCVPATDINPDQVVAVGTAIQAALHGRAEAFDDVVLTDVCPYSLGVEVVIERSDGSLEAGHFLPIIERNTTVPVSRVERLHTVCNDQRHVRCNVYQGESRLTRNNIKLGSVQIDVEPAPAGEQFVDVRFTYNSNGILEVLMQLPDSGKSERVVIDNRASGLSESEIQQSLERLACLKIHPRDDYPNAYLLSQLEALYEESLGSKREHVASLIRSFEGVLAQQDLKLAAEYRQTLAPEVQRLTNEGSVF